MGKPFEQVWQWTKRHPFTVTGALVLATALLLPRLRSAARHTADFDSDETPLFV